MTLIRERNHFTSALTWVPGDVLLASRYAADAEDEAHALCAVARELGVDIAWVPAEETWATRAAELLLAEEIQPAWAVAGVLGRVAGFLGWAETIRQSTSRPRQLAAVIDRAQADAQAIVRIGAEAGCDLLVLADDLASISGWIVSPDFALGYLVPSYHTVVQQWHAQTVFHSDGDICALYPALLQAGFDAVHIASIRPEALEAVCSHARSLGLDVVGGISATASTEASVGEVGPAAGRLAMRGPLVIADDGGIASSEQLTTVAEALRAAREGHAGREA